MNKKNIIKNLSNVKLKFLKNRYGNDIIELNELYSLELMGNGIWVLYNLENEGVEIINFENENEMIEGMKELIKYLKF